MTDFSVLSCPFSRINIGVTLSGKLPDFGVNVLKVNNL